MAGENQGKAYKGSRYQLQRYVNENQELLNTYIVSASPTLISFGANEKSIEWVSPLEHNSEDKPYYEYRDNFLKPLGLDDAENTNRLRDFWPKNGPQWDGLAVVRKSDENGYLLVEAKAHSKETFSNMGASDEESKEKIRRAFSRTQGYMGIPVNDWTSGHYQLANRLAFLYFLNKELELDTWLVLVNFVGDTTHVVTEMEEWLSLYNGIFKNIGIDHNAVLMDRLIMVFPPAFKE